MGPSQEVCFTPFAGMRSKGTGEPAPVPPPNAFDTRGCLPLTEVSDGCCSPAKAGPRFASGKCCYETCPGSCCGRAFVVDGLARVAPLGSVAGAQGAATSVDAAALEAAQAWLADAQLEHASIASFARFTLELLSLGAPMDLVRRASEATLEEVRHAELCLVLAETLGAGAHRAGPLPQAAGLPARPLSEIVVAAIREGCVGETLAAIAAQRQLERAESAPARDVLTVIARDEARHAELGWAFVGWALRQEPALLPLARHTFEQSLRAIEAAAPAATSSSPSRAARYGRLEPGEIDAMSRQAVRSLLRPVSESLLGCAERQPS